METLDKKFLNKLDKDKININWNKNLIKMDLFLSFLNIEVHQQPYSSSDLGWTTWVGENDLVIRGGIIGQIEYLDNLQYGEKLDNPYNNYINPFYLFNIFNESGKKFFLEYYKDDIQGILKEVDDKMKLAAKIKEETFKFWERFGNEKI